MMVNSRASYPELVPLLLKLLRDLSSGFTNSKDETETPSICPHFWSLNISWICQQPDKGLKT